MTVARAMFKALVRNFDYSEPRSNLGRATLTIARAMFKALVGNFDYNRHTCSDDNHAAVVFGTQVNQQVSGCSEHASIFR